MKKTNVYDLVLIAIMTAVICVMGPLSIPIGPVPISLTNLALYVIIFVIGWRKATISYLVYLAIGLVGVPVFSGFSGGVGKLFGPTGGYLIGFTFMTIIAGVFVELFQGKYYMYMLGMILGTIVCYLFGTAWLAYEAGMSFGAALTVGVLPFIIGDLIKMVVSCLIGPPISKQIKKVRPVNQ